MERPLTATGPQPPHDWTAIHWPDIASRDTSRWIAVLPLAAIEQHGPHLPLGTDAMIAEAYLAETRKFLPSALPVTFLPVQNVGLSTEHVAFPGTLTLSIQAALQSWIAIGESVARAGVQKLVIVTSHGGNSAAMSMVARDLRARLSMSVVTTSWGRLSTAEEMFSVEEVRHGVHGGAVETSILMARYPQHVRADSNENFAPSSIAMERDFKILSLQHPAPLAWQAEDLHPSGAAGDATLARAELGERLLANGARQFCELLTELDRYTPTSTGR